MKSRRQIELHRRSLGEIRDIMNAMKNLAYMETRKLDRFLTAQHAVLDGIEAVVSDFVTSFPEAGGAPHPGPDLTRLLVGVAGNATRQGHLSVDRIRAGILR
jgi:hypothetical protein